MVGMNVETVRGIARSLKSQAASMHSVLARVDGLVNSIQNEWRGADAQAFCSAWRSDHRPRLVDLIEKVEGLARAASNNADEQERVSAGSPGQSGFDGSVGGGGGGGGGAGW
jgi:WXG100 family type VII secretion target